MLEEKKNKLKEVLFFRVRQPNFEPMAQLDNYSLKNQIEKWAHEKKKVKVCSNPIRKTATNKPRKRTKKNQVFIQAKVSTTVLMAKK